MLKVESLTKESFQEYGNVLSMAKEVADAKGEAFRFSADIAIFAIEGNLTVGVLEGKKREFVLTCMEQHRDTPEVLFAMEGDSVLCVGRPDSSSENITDIRAFLMKQGDTVVMNKGCWHWVPYPIDKEICKTQVIFKQDTGANDMKVVQLPEAIVINL